MSDSHRAEVRNKLIDITPTLGIRERDAIMALLDSERERWIGEVKNLLPAKKHHTESDRNIAYREGFNDALDAVSKVLDELA